MKMIVFATATHVGFTNRLPSPAHIFPTNTRTFVATVSGSQCCCTVPQVCGGLPRGFSFLSVGVARKSVRCSYLVHASRVSYFISRRSFTQFLPLLFTNPYKFRVCFFWWVIVLTIVGLPDPCEPRLRLTSTAQRLSCLVQLE